jgi:uncharacterized membrane protein YgdD (TMEM256/DUF423 family)
MRSLMSPWQRLFATLGALCCASAVGMGAWAAHAASGAAQARLETAVLYLFLHGLGLLALAPQLDSRGRLLAATTLVVGVLMFCGSLVAGAAFGASTRLAPFGGGALILAWLALAGLLLRGR